MLGQPRTAQAAEFRSPAFLCMGAAQGVSWRGEYLCRGIRAEQVEWCRTLLSQGIVRQLVEKELMIETWPLDEKTNEFPLFVAHRAIPTVTFPAEWCELQFKAAALKVLDLEIFARRHD